MFETDPALNAGIIKKHIDTTERIESRNGVGNVRFISYVEASFLGAQTLFAQEFCRGMKFLGVPTVQDHSGAMLCKTNGKAVTDSAIGTRDEDTTSGEIEEVLVHWKIGISGKRFAVARSRTSRYDSATLSTSPP